MPPGSRQVPSPDVALTLLLLPHDNLVSLLRWLEVCDLSRLAATCRLLHYGQRSPEAPNPVEDVLRLRTGPPRAEPVDSRNVVRELLLYAR
jgi:hypothetical protein